MSIIILYESAIKTKRLGLLSNKYLNSLTMSNCVYTVFFLTTFVPPAYCYNNNSWTLIKKMLIILFGNNVYAYGIFFFFKCVCFEEVQILKVITIDYLIVENHKQ